MAKRYRLVFESDLPLQQIFKAVPNGNFYVPRKSTQNRGLWFKTQQERDEAELNLDNAFGDKIEFPNILEDE